MITHEDLIADVTARLATQSLTELISFYEKSIAYTQQLGGDYFYEEQNFIDDAFDYLVKDNPGLAVAIAELMVHHEVWAIRSESYWLLRDLCGNDTDVDRLMWEVVVPMLIADPSEPLFGDVWELVDETPSYEEFVRAKGWSETLDFVLIRTHQPAS